MSIRVIPAQPSLHAAPTGTSPSGESHRPRQLVAAYCRVSTELEEQESSYESQVRHYTEMIRANPLWELAGIYADEGITGTQAKKRPEFLRMIEDCKAGKIQMVITKSISRFARNTLECLQYIRLLREKNIPILFEKENINTMDSRGELLITIMASIAQQESLSISQNVRMGIQYRFQQGKPMLNQTWFLGYTKNSRGELVIVPEEADSVRRIFRDFLEGLSYGEIMQGLERDGIRTGAGKEKWYDTTIKSMLKNEKYMGDLLLQKSYTQDVLTRKHVKNDGAFPRYYVQNAHPPIVPREVFLRVQGELLRRRNVLANGGKREIHRSNIGMNYRILCPECGGVYRRCRKKAPGVTTWRCKSRMEKRSTCCSRIMPEVLLQEAVVEAFRRLPQHREDLEAWRARLRRAPIAVLAQEIAALEREQNRLEDIVSDLARSGQESCQDLNAYRQQIDTLRHRREELLGQKAAYDIQETQLMTLLGLIDALTGQKTEAQNSSSSSADAGASAPAALPDAVSASAPASASAAECFDTSDGACRDLTDFFRRTDRFRHHGPVTEYSDEDVIRYVESITVFPEKLSIRFKAGLCLDVAK